MLAGDTRGDHQLEEHLTIHALYSGWAMAELDACLIVIWRGVVTQAALRRINVEILRLAKLQPGTCAYVNVIEKASPHPAGPERKLAIEGVARPGKSLACMAAVIEGNELRSTVVRAIITGMMLLLPRRQPTKLFKTTNKMAAWVRSQISSVRASELVRAIEILRNKMPIA